MELWTVEGVITGFAWTVVCMAAVVYLPIWHFLVSILISINILICALMIHTLFKRPGFKYTQILFDITWSPCIAMFNYSNIYLMEPHLQGEQKLLPLGRGIPRWIRHQAFIISVISLNSGTSTDLILYISWIMFCNSLTLIIKEILGSENSKDRHLNCALQTDNNNSNSLISQSDDEVNYNTRMWFWIADSVICILCIAYNYASMRSFYFCITVLFVCLSYLQIQLRVMIEFKEAHPYVMDGLVDLAVLAVFILMDIIMSGSLFVSALYNNSSSLFIGLTYCNTFSAIMEFRLLAWLPLRNERFLIQHIRWATKEELLSYNDVCAICLVCMKSARVTVCQHLFHGKCLRLSLKNNTNCPMCKSALFPTFGHAHMLL